MTTEAVVTHIEHFQHRVIQDAIKDAHAGYWRHRARTFQWARPRPGDFVGLATPDELAARDAALVEIIDACMARAHTSVLGVVA